MSKFYTLIYWLILTKILYLNQHKVLFIFRKIIFQFQLTQTFVLKFATKLSSKNSNANIGVDFSHKISHCVKLNVQYSICNKSYIIFIYSPLAAIKKRQQSNKFRVNMMNAFTVHYWNISRSFCYLYSPNLLHAINIS